MIGLYYPCPLCAYRVNYVNYDLSVAHVVKYTVDLQQSHNVAISDVYITSLPGVTKVYDLLTNSAKGICLMYDLRF